MHSFMGLWKGTKGLLFPRKAYPKLVKEWSEIERKTTTASARILCSKCGCVNSSADTIHYFALEPLVEYYSYINGRLEYLNVYDKFNKRYAKVFADNIPSKFKPLWLIFCKSCGDSLLDDDSFGKKSYTDWVKAGVPDSIVRLFATKKISEDQMLRLLAVYNRGIDRWSDMICEIIEGDLEPFFFRYKEPFDACLKLKEFEENLHVDEIELLLRTGSKEQHLHFIQKIVAEERFEFLVEGFYNRGALLKSTFNLDADTGILSLDYVANKKWVAFFQGQESCGKKEVEFIDELLSQKEFHDVAEKIHDKSISISEVLDLYYFRGFSKHPNALMEVIEGANWKAVAVKNGFYEF